MHIKAHLSGGQHTTQLRYFGGFIMKQETTLSSIIALVKSRVRANPFYEEQGLKLLKFLELYLPY